jgi:NAD(P)-dependent dehydrogenase (short-subunit alcohol dehydrogenase family)
MAETTKDQIALVTGAASGLGKSLVTGLAKKGYQVIGADYNQQGLDDLKAEFQSKGMDITCIQSNIASLDDVKNMMHTIDQKYGRLDLLVNNAGIIHPFSRVEKVDYETIERVMSVNFWGTTYMTKEAIPLLKKGHKPALINVASMGALIPTPGQSFYCASKAAIALLTQTLAFELKEEGIDVLLACPGTMQTKIVQNAAYTDESRESSKELISAIEKSTAGITPDYAAKKIIAALKNRPAQFTIGMDAYVLTNMHKVLPSLTNRLFAKALKMNPAVKKALQ